MPTYYPGHPSDPATAGRFPQLVESTEVHVDEVEVTRATNGAVRMKRKSPTMLREYNISHILSTTDRNTLLSFFTSNKNSTFNLHYRGTDSFINKAMFVAPPNVSLIGGEYWQVTVSLMETP